MQKLLLTGVISVLLSGCFSEVKQAEVAPIYVDTIRVTDTVSVNEKHYKGVTVPADLTPLAFRTTGKVHQLKVRPGQLVQQGEILATLDDTKTLQQLREAKAELDLSSKQFLRGQALKQKGMLSESEYDELKANQSLSEVRYHVLEQQLKYTQLRAPFDGTVASTQAETHQNINAGEPILSVYRDQLVYVDLAVSEDFIQALKQLTDPYKVKASIHFLGSEQPYTAGLKLFSGQPLPELKGYLARFALPAEKSKILPGTGATVTINTDQFSSRPEVAYQVPVHLLMAGDEPEQFAVWKYSQGQAVKVPVQVSSITASGAVINQGLALNDQLITTQLSKLTQNRDIKIVNGSQQ